MRPAELHFTLRACVLGANDGIVSTASLIVGVAATEASRSNGLVAGAMSMAPTAGVGALFGAAL